MNRLNLETCYPLSPEVKSGLPVLVDLNWFGKIMTQPDGGIIPSRSAYVEAVEDSEVVL